MYLHGTHAFLVLSVFAVQLSLAMYQLPSRKQVQIKFTGSTYTERGRLVGRDTVTQSCNNILLSDCCVALRDIMWMHMHPVHEVYFALYLEFVPTRIEITGLPDANSIGAAWVNENQNDEPNQKGCQGQFWQYGVGPGDWKVDIDGAKALEAKWFDASGGINKDAIGGDQQLVDEVTNGKLPKYLDNGQGDMQYESTSKDKGSDRSYIQGLKPCETLPTLYILETIH
ncbi:MAG: hypothetical protein M1835_004206 [Candelina submexicana]|nr:MAG: hypothetical protein M1835_004206 [Candelina submexicana]